MRRSGHLSRPSASTCCLFSSLKTFAIPAGDHGPSASSNVSAPPHRWPVFTRPSLADFGCPPRVDRTPCGIARMGWWRRTHKTPTPLLAGAERLDVQLCLFKRRMVRAAAERRCELELQGVVLPKAEWANVVAPGGLLEDKETAAWARIAAATRFHGPPPGTCRRNSRGDRICRPRSSRAALSGLIGATPLRDCHVSAPPTNSPRRLASAERLGSTYCASPPQRTSAAFQSFMNGINASRTDKACTVSKSL